jgi:hypothetical protein
LHTIKLNFVYSHEQSKPISNEKSLGKSIELQKKLKKDSYNVGKLKKVPQHPPQDLKVSLLQIWNQASTLRRAVALPSK